MAGNGRDQHLGHIIEHLERISCDAERLLNDHPLRLEAVEQMAAHAAAIRGFLTALIHIKVSSEAQDQLRHVGRAMMESFLELEGRIKELRNDLARLEHGRPDSGSDEEGRKKPDRGGAPA